MNALYIIAATTGFWALLLNLLLLTNAVMVLIPPVGLHIMDAYLQRNELIELLYDTIRTCPLPK